MSAKKNLPPAELTPLAIGVGIIIGLVMTAANVYLGLYAGMTVSASIPAAVFATGIFAILGRRSALETNIVQTMASAGESLAAGAIFTLPALVLIGSWQDFKFWPTTLISISGGVLGVIFMIPLRRALILEDKDLTYPEGVACASVIKSGTTKGDQRGLSLILKGLALGGTFKLLVSGIKLLSGTIEKAVNLGDRFTMIAMDASPALIGIGFIVKLAVATSLMIGAAVGTFVIMPLVGMEPHFLSMDPIDAAMTIWSTKIRYVGVGSMLVAGLWSVWSVRKGLQSSIAELRKNYGKKATGKVDRLDTDLSTQAMKFIFLGLFLLIFGLYSSLLQSLPMSLATTLIMIVMAFPVTAVASYICGLVGSSNNPVSGLIICTLLVSGALLLALGFEGDSGVLCTLGVAAVVCCAGATAADCSQDLKTGAILGSTPRSQQIAQIIGVIIPAFTIGPVLTLLHEAYGIGEGLRAPQATLLASISKAMFGLGDLPLNMVMIGVSLGIGVLVINTLARRFGSKFNINLMCFAVGIYLPIGLMVPVFVGAVIANLVERAQKRSKKKDAGYEPGVLFGSGLIAGEAVMGVLLAILLVLELDIGFAADFSFKQIWAMIGVAAVCRYMYSVAKTV